MAKQSLFSACKRVFRDGISGTYEVGNNNIFLELYGQADIDNNNEIGNSSEENIVVVAGDTITIPEGYTLTPVKPKKSLVVICNTFVNNGTVSMYQKAPNVLPHDLFIIPRIEFGGKADVIIPAYANNGKENTSIDPTTSSFDLSELNGNNGTDRNCGSGGLGANHFRQGPRASDYLSGYGTISGSGYAFGGGAGSGGVALDVRGTTYNNSVNSIYPMRASDGYKNTGYYFASGGVGNPKGTDSAVGQYGTLATNNSGCGGRIIIFCCSFTNNGLINVNGTSANIIASGTQNAHGGASGAGAIDIFYANKNSEGTLSAIGGAGGFGKYKTTDADYKSSYTGAGGNGSITLTAWSKDSILKPIAKYMSKANMVYFLTNYIERLKQGED